MPTTLADLPTLPAIIDGRVGHTRVTPLKHAFTYRHHQWLVDVDDLPRQPWWLRRALSFRAGDHLGNGVIDGTIRGDLESVLARDGVDAGPGGRMIMLTHPRTFGHVFNPLSVFWAFRADGSLAAAVLEVHNTYAQRHAYVLRPDVKNRAQTDKQFYVSPFNDVSGRYDVRLEVHPDRVRVVVTLYRQDRVVFTASASGRAIEATPRAATLMALRSPFMPQRVSALIKLHGIWLWARRLPIATRPVHHPEVLPVPSAHLSRPAAPGAGS